MSRETDRQGDIYSVSVKSILDEGWIYALQLDPLLTQRYYTGPARTEMTVRLADQSEMLGLLNRLHDMGLKLLSVELCTVDDQ